MNANLFIDNFVVDKAIYEGMQWCIWGGEDLQSLTSYIAI